MFLFGNMLFSLLLPSGGCTCIRGGCSGCRVPGVPESYVMKALTSIIFRYFQPLFVGGFWGAVLGAVFGVF